MFSLSATINDSVRYFVFKIVVESASSNFLCLFHLNSPRPDPIPSAILFHLPSFRASFLGFILVQYVASAVRFRYYIMKLHRTNITREYWILIYRRLTRRSGNPVVDLQFHLHVMKFVNLSNHNNNKCVAQHTIDHAQFVLNIILIRVCFVEHFLIKWIVSLYFVFTW